MRSVSPLAAVLLAACLVCSAASARSPQFTLAQALDFSFDSQLVAASHADAIAWVREVRGVRNVWIARGPQFTPHQLTQLTADDGQEITQLTFSPDGAQLVYVRGGDHDQNWPAEGNLSPDPDSSTRQAVTAIWAVPLEGGAPRKIADGDGPALSARGELAYVRDGRVWTAPLDGGEAAQLFFDRGKARDLRWSPDGSHLAFVSQRGTHSFIGVFGSKDQPLEYLAPSTSKDDSPRWSEDGARIAFVRQPGTGGPPEPILTRIVHPWEIWVASVADGSGHVVWKSPNTLSGSYPQTEGDANLNWGAGERLVFVAYLDDWPHLYSVPSAGGDATLLTPGAFMVEHVTESRDRRHLIYDANTGPDSKDGERRHLFSVAVDRGKPTEITSGATLEWTPVAAGADTIAFVSSSPQSPPVVASVGLDGKNRKLLGDSPVPADFPGAQFIDPKPVTFRAADGLEIHGQLFVNEDSRRGASEQKPGVIFVHGGPPRQMLLGWHYMDYYSNAYAVNEYLATHGFIVLSVNYRLGIGYGRAYQQPDHAGLAGAAEYQDVLAGAHFLQTVPGVDAQRIGIWGGSYGGYLTALGLARNSDLFKSGVDLHGVHDWSALLDAWTDSKSSSRYEKGDREEATRVAWAASPDSSIASWRSPVLLVHGDDDRNVPFAQTVDIVRRLGAQGVPFEELVIPNETHDFLRHADWLRADEATADFLRRTLGERRPIAHTK